MYLSLFFQNTRDVRADDLGSWKCIGSCIATFHVDIRDGACCIVINKSASPTAQVVHIRWQYHVHGTDPDLRLIAFVERKYCVCVHGHACVCCAYGNIVLYMYMHVKCVCVCVCLVLAYAN